MSWVLLGNDDGVDSPALLPFAAALEEALQLPVRVCVPAGERSWSSKAVTRDLPVRTERVRRGGREVVAVHGTPADAVQLGLYGVFADEFAGAPPRVVVTGINLGFNSGTAFLASSGTVWAAAEAAFAGLPTIAVSTGPTTGFEDFGQWHDAVLEPGVADHWRALAQVAVDVAGDVAGSDLLDHCDLVSVNLPWEVTPDSARTVTQLTPLAYGPLFDPAGEGVWEPARRLTIELGEHGADGDVATLRAGQVSITPVVLPRSARVPDDTRAVLERP